MNKNIGVVLVGCCLLTACVKTNKAPNYQQDLIAQLAEISYDKGDYTSAEKFYHQASKKYPDDISMKHRLAQSYAKQGKRAEAIKIYQQVIEKDPKASLALRHQANLYLSTGRVDDSARNYSKALRLNAKDTKSLNNLGLLLGMTSNPELALRCYKQKNGANTSTSMQNNLAMTQAILGNTGAALRTLAGIKNDDKKIAATLDYNRKVIGRYHRKLSKLTPETEGMRKKILDDLAQNLGTPAEKYRLSPGSLDEVSRVCGDFERAFDLQLGHKAWLMHLGERSYA